MANRGCTITVSLLDSDGATMTLPVALHSPLSVLKDQLATITSISVQEQVLILCDLTDKDRNNDRLLQENISLHACNISDGAFLTLHSLGMDKERKNQITVDALKRLHEKTVIDKDIVNVETPITAAQADHSYNGIIFDIESTGPYEINITSVLLAGMLGRVRVFARDKPWEAGPRNSNSNHWWAHQESLSTSGWELVADQFCRPSWDKPIEIKLHTTLHLLPHERKALYCHSGLPDDLGIQYQSYRKHDVVAQDDKIALYPGLGHTGSQPFDDVDGWYRSYRGLAGSVSYKFSIKGWSPFDHNIYTPELKEGVKTMLLCRQSSITSSLSRESSMNSSIDSGDSELFDTEMGEIQPRPLVHALPLHVLYYIMEFMNWDWFENLKVMMDEDDEDEQASHHNDKTNRNGRISAAQYIYRMYVEQLLGNQPLGGGGAIEYIDEDDEDDSDYDENDFSDNGDDSDDNVDEDNDNDYVDVDDDDDDDDDGSEEEEDSSIEKRGDDDGEGTWREVPQQEEIDRSDLISAIERYVNESENVVSMEEDNGGDDDDDDEVDD